MATLGESKASIAVALLAFLVAGVSLWHGQAGLTAMVATACGFALVIARLRQDREEEDARRGLDEKLQYARELQQRGALQEALRVVHQVADLAQSAKLQRAALELIAWCELAVDRPEAARDALSCLREAGAADPYCQAAVEDACGNSLWALHIVEREARRRELSREATLFRIDLYARVRGLEAACALTLEQLGRLQLEDVERVLRFADSAGDSRAASALAHALPQLRRA
ncbi:MAG: hypothetical protein EOO73_02100 [Myxococcales bacterium]|nr:MAG: hypothetical protein EOO73_02100 [Myxococcales bacterium]